MSLLEVNIICIAKACVFSIYSNGNNTFIIVRAFIANNACWTRVFSIMSMNSFNLIPFKPIIFITSVSASVIKLNFCCTIRNDVQVKFATAFAT